MKVAGHVLKARNSIIAHFAHKTRDESDLTQLAHVFKGVAFLCHQCCSFNDDVEWAPLPSYPIPRNVLTNAQDYRGFRPATCRDISYVTLEAFVRRMPNEKIPGCDGIQRELYIYIAL